jgi:hypothetical protein
MQSVSPKILRLNILNQMTKFALAVKVYFHNITENKKIKITNTFRFEFCCYRLNGKENKQEINYFHLNTFFNLQEDSEERLT